MRRYLFIALIALPVLALELTNRRGFFPTELKALAPKPEKIALKAKIIDITEKSGLHFTHEVLRPTIQGIEHIKGWVLGSGATVSVSDVDLDGYQDVYFTSMELGKNNKLFRNQGDGTFRNETQKFFKWPTNRTWISLKPTFFDCDNDGDQDLFLNTSSCPVLYKNDGGKGFTDWTSEAGLSVCHTVNGNVVDMNNDGLLDLTYASYNIYSADHQMDNFMNADRGIQFQAMFKNKGECRFEKVENTGIEDVGLTHAIGVLDVRGIDRKDLWFVTDVGTDRLFLDNGDGTYTNRSDLLAWAFNRHGMSFDVSYDEDATRPHVSVSHVFAPSFVVEGNALWHLDEKESMANVARERGVAECGHAWGSKFFDLDFDGDEEQLVINGFVSKNPKKDYLFPLALLGQTHRGYMKFAKNWPKMNDASLYGYQKNCIFVREGNSYGVPAEENDFTNDVLDGRAIVTLDLLNNGRPAIIVANQIQPAKIFQVEPDSGNHWLGLKLQGSCSNRDAFGSKIKVRAGGKNQTRWYYPSNGFSSQSESQLLIGLGKSDIIEELVIRWPRGFEEKFTNLSVNQYHKLKEGAGCAQQN